MSTIPVLVMSRNEGKYLQDCVNSIINTVKVEVDIYIIDNASNDNYHLEVLKQLDSIKNVYVIRNKSNLWVLGLNKTIREIKNKYPSQYFFLTDGDIDFSECLAAPCWLSYLISKMNDNISVGKIGLSLDWAFLERNKPLNEILLQEKGLYSEDKKIRSLYISPVDTTACLFRRDWSIEDTACFYPNHMQYLRPELYSCRTDRNILVKHLGWDNYLMGKLSQQEVNEKVICFSLVGGAIKREIKQQASLRVRIFNTLFARGIFRVWVLRRYYHLFKYVLKKARGGFDGQTN